MHRRQFMGTCAAAALGAAVAPPFSVSAATEHSAMDPSTLASPFLFSVMLWTVDPKLPFDQRIAKVADAGYHAVELVGEWEAWSKDAFSVARKQLQHLSLTVDACSGINASLCDPARRDALFSQIRTILPVLAEFQCSRLILLSGNKVPGLSHEQQRANCVESLKRASDLTAAQNIELLLENIDPEENLKYFLTSVAEGFQIIRELNNPRVRFLYDFFHEQIAEGNLIAKLEKNLHFIGLVHVADVPGRHEPGTGEINYANIFRKLGQLHYSHYIAMEFLPTADTVTSLRSAREFAQKYLEEGRSQASRNSAMERVHATA
jgi:hydroxypyruvate isomerase